jgi:phosphoribosylformylglycinamidine synthase
MQAEKALQAACLALIRSRLVASCHDLSEGGLAVALVESCIFTEVPAEMLGAKIRLETELRQDMYLFGEDQSRILISVKPEKTVPMFNLIKRFNVQGQIIGHVTAEQTLIIGDVITTDLKTIADAYYQGFPTQSGRDS